MRTEQDARTSPWVGDIFRKGKTWRKVIGFRENYGYSSAVVFETKNGCRGWSSNFRFAKWVADADVLFIAETEKKDHA